MGLGFRNIFLLGSYRDCINVYMVWHGARNTSTDSNAACETDVVGKCTSTKGSAMSGQSTRAVAGGPLKTTR